MDKPTADEPPASNRWLIFLKEECETCTLILPVLDRLIQNGIPIELYVQDSPDFLGDWSAIYDNDLSASFRWDIETTPTLIRTSADMENARIEGWNREEWQTAFDIDDLGHGLPNFRPGCGSKSREPGIYERLLAEFGNPNFASPAIEIDHWDDEMEACFNRGWTDGLPVVPPTDARILRMLQGTDRDAHEVLGRVPPNLSPITVEKAAINAVMAGCKPAYFPVVLAALKAALEPTFTLHGLLCTTCFSSPIIIVNGPSQNRLA